MNFLLHRLFAAAAMLSMCPTISLAMPSLSGNTLTWPDDGWHQVQRADTFETVCEGIVSSDSSNSGGPCVVDPGTYIVINHTSGERFENIIVDATSPTPSVEGVSVEGNRITWPDDGWYQVQDATTFETICEGGTNCTVQPGSYIVINHSTGQRFSDITVASDSETDGAEDSRPASVEVIGDTIRWPDDGWYQVQNAVSFRL